MSTIQKFINAASNTTALNAIKSGYDKVKTGLSSVQGWAGAAVNTASKGSTFVGMDYTKVDTIRGAIRDYVKGIQDIADKLNTDADPSNALKGEVVEKTKAYLSSVDQMVKAYISTLLAYSDKMAEYAEAYGKSDTSLASDVSDAASEMTSAAEQVQYTEQR